MRITSYILTCLVFAFGASLYGQNQPDSITTRLIREYEKFPQEEIYLQTSKDIYETGEDLWFKAYQLSTRDHSLSTESRTLYLQMLSEADSIVWQEKYPILNGISDGHVYLDEKLPEGDYALEAYMRTGFYNDSCSFSSFRKIKVVSDIAKEERADVTASETPFRFDVFPEGGNLVSRIRAQLAFKATDEKGYPVNVSGTLYEKDSVIVHFESIHDGMGKLSFTPLADKSYKIVLDNGQTCALPSVYLHGLSLHLASRNDDFVEFVIFQNEGASIQNISLLGQMNGVPCCLGKATVQDSVRIKIPFREYFPVQGIAEFTLFDQQNHPVAERLVFVNSKKELNITAEFDKKAYMVKNKALLKIKVTDEEGNPAPAHLGVSVFDKAYADPSYSVNIQTHSLLSSQIRGNIHNPYYYFNKNNKDRKEALDLLLLTQGWRRYRWKYENDTNTTGAPFLSDDIEGIQTIKNKKMKGSEQLLQVSDPNNQAALIWVDTLGNFSLDPEVLYSLRGGYLYLKPLVGKENGAKLTFEDPFEKINLIRKQKGKYYPVINASLFENIPRDNGPLRDQYGTILLDEVTVTAKAHKPIRDKYMGRLDSLAQINLGPWVCDCEKDPYPSYLENYRHGYTHHPSMNYSGKKLTPIKGKVYQIVKYEPVGPNGSYVLTDIQRITYQGSEFSDEELLRMNNLWRVKGYYGEREFYMPDDVDMLSSLPDARNTLLWNPTVIVDDKGEATIEFYTSDLNTRFIGRVEGVGNNGLLGVLQADFNVMKVIRMK